MNIALLHRLLAEGESSHLDYKSEQYRFVTSTDGDKAELLKDILAMANAWRETDAHILIGVKEHTGQRAEVVGITEHLDDASLQEFVNKKTNRPIHFSYKPFEVDGKTIAVLHIPLQPRPFFLRKRFASLDPDKVNLRRGSSTDVADADEIYLMGASLASPETPSLRVEFSDLKTREALGQTFSLTRSVLRPLPDDRLPTTRRRSGIVAQLPGPNQDYWYELRDYMVVNSVFV